MASNDDIQRFIGAFEAQIENLQHDVRKMANETTASRSKVYEKIEQISREVQAGNAANVQIIKRLDAIEPEIGEYRKFRERAIGARMMLGLLIASVGGSFVIALQWVWSHLPFGR